MQLLGEADIEINGKVLRVEQGNATLDVGGKVGEVQMGSKRVNGYSYKTESSKLDITISLAKGEGVKLYQGVEASAVFRADTGQVWTVPSTVLTSNPGVKSGSGGSVQLTFEGEPAKEKL